MTKRAVFFLVGLLWVSAAAAEGPGIKALQEYFDAVQTLRGGFVQVTVDDYGDILEQSTGELAIQRPNRFRWSYHEPFEQEIVADGERLWVYDVDLEQATVRPLDEVLGFGPALLLSGDFETLQETFHIHELEDGWLELTPRQTDWEFQAVRMLMVDSVPQVIEVDSGLGQITQLELFDLERNPRIDDRHFRFQPPPGVDVIAPRGMPQD